ncbi:MAG: methyltransferase domain-containing protein [Nitrospinaceae bacterium]|nr:class I SAM-dependent methyltransferase [Nitrospinaceae bacterium]NIR53917.1 class I SAM-dependent methyltransferase [Nitrospinaceae bacterium]NIS84334.1 class I SAM-dependent methyltransferase [Nitrospinaceae bacterium]NIT81138.1 class I SAM-dependent methyltransferase [Nitrospinaceae bacterium]NIU43420.1 class I SAM-dependent methyltransferase [Nitrospinaceae bacterium]
MSVINYWEQHYESYIKLTFPSQFAAFCLNEMPHDRTIIDCGCGNGRDSFFFDKYGKTVIGLDASTAAINFCENHATDSNAQRVNFHVANFEDKDNLGKIEKLLKQRDDQFLIYSRFFLHAINEKSEENFLDFCNNICNSGDEIYLEFRTIDDRRKRKIEPKHFRRFIDVDILKKKVVKKGFAIEYFSQGIGFAKYKSEDANVARLILKVT